MSVIIAVKKDDTIYFGADTQATNSYMKRHFTSESNAKLFAFENGVVIGVTGCAVVQQIFVAHPEWFDFKNEKELNKEYLNLSLIPNVKKALEPYDLDDDEFAVFIAYKSRLYELYGSFVSLRIESKGVIGSGSDVIKCKVYNLDVNGDINAQILDTLRLSAKFDSNVGAPFLLLNTKDLKLEIKEN